jgi:hypothetical protein
MPADARADRVFWYMGEGLIDLVISMAFDGVRLEERGHLFCESEGFSWCSGLFTSKVYK